MKPVTFPEVNTNLTSPKDNPSLDCLDLPVYAGNNVHGQPVMVSCWELSDAEIAHIVKHKRLWSTVYGTGHPPVYFSVMNVFNTPKQMTVSKDIVEQSTIWSDENGSYVITKAPKAPLEDLSVEENDGVYTLLGIQDGLVYEYHEQVKVLGYLDELPDLGLMVEDLVSAGFTPSESIVLLRTT